jgi:hypothetical protein
MLDDFLAILSTIAATPAMISVLCTRSPSSGEVTGRPEQATHEGREGPPSTLTLT